MDGQRKRRRSSSPWKKCPKHKKLHQETKKHEPLTLLDLAAKCVASNIPFERVEEQIQRVPEPVQLRVVHWSFPRNEKDICMYSSLHTSVCHAELKRLPFQKGLHLLEENAVKDVLQVGDFIVQQCTESVRSLETEEFKVSIGFDRCKITSVSCSCGTKDILWCAHVVALSLFRIRHPSKVTLRVPISETLSQMNRDQLQKLVQYLLTEHHTEVLPTAQRLADEILKKSSEINRLSGAPDPTAGASVNDENCWHLDAGQVRDQVRSYLSPGGHSNSGRHLLSMFAKVREMLRVHDKNGSRMLSLITEQFLADPRLQIWKQQGTSMNDKCRQLWDQLGSLWVCVVLNPDATLSEKTVWKKSLEAWSQMDVCPLENPDVREEANNNQRVRDESSRRTVFSRAIATCELNWEDGLLRRIIGDGCDEQYLTWTEDVPVAAARVDALRAHGYPTEALRLAVAVARGMKEEQAHKFHKMEELEERYGEEELETRLYEESPGEETVEGWIGHALDPIVVLYDTLLEASTEDQSDIEELDSYKCTQQDVKSYTHICAPGRLNDTESYLTLAVETALMGLGQQRSMPDGFYAQDKACRQEEHLIAQLNLLSFDKQLMDVLRDQTELLYGGGPFSGLGLGIHHRSVPMHTFARFLFSLFLSKDPELAYRVGLRAMRFLVLDETADANDQGLDAMRTSLTRWYTLGHLESQQCELALRMLSGAKGNKSRMQSVLESSQKHIHSASQLFRLAQDALKLAGFNSVGDCHDYCMLQVAMDLGLQVLRMTLNSQNWRRREMVQWSIECAVELGTAALSIIMKNWSTLFTPTEATSLVAATVMSPTTAIRLKLTMVEKEALQCCARALALQCASREPQLCCLSALTLCEKEPAAFEAAYYLVLEAASSISPTQLFAIARYMEHKNFGRRSFKLAILAIKHFTLAYNQDTHPSIGDIQWTCALAHSLGREELGKVIPLIIKAVQCPSVLSDILFRCAFAQTSPACGGSFGKLALCDKEPLTQLLESTISAYVNTVHSRLNHISPRHYGDFVDFLCKAQDVFELAVDGPHRFRALINNMKVLYKGKKKLMQLVKLKFG
ncbi:predicted protein [Nematostella vectensis]|uniref:SWIM-type domain-containing protein n=1 Tax=Nematostella vectensis TaxID=45351 RepID=A7RKB7_NEMVE|nr:predicted protein [Nematostella vectensis]|eukprot:XP_001640202.1 predicted protein [Nematostella vectensis]